MARPEQPSRPLIVVEGVVTTRIGCATPASACVTSKFTDGQRPAFDEIVPMMTTTPISSCGSGREGWNGFPQLKMSVALTKARLKEVVMEHQQTRHGTAKPLRRVYPGESR